MRKSEKPAKPVAAATPKTQITSLLYSSGRAAKRLGLGKTKTLELIRSGRLEAAMLDDRIVVTEEAIQAFVRGNLKVGYRKGKAVAS